MNKKHAGGRPSDYKPEYCEEVVKFMGMGHSMKAFAASIGKHSDTLQEWRKKHSEFSAAIKKGREACQLWWEKLGMAMATGHKTATHDYRKGNPTVFIWMTKNILGWTDRIDMHTEVEPIILRIKGEKEVYELGTRVSSEAGRSLEKRK